MSGRAEQKYSQIGYGDARRADEQIFPRGLQSRLRVAVVDDSRAAEGGGLQQDPRDGYVVGEVYARDGRDEQHEQREVGAVGGYAVVAQIFLRVQEYECRHDDHQYVEYRSRLVEGEECARGGEERPAEEQTGGEEGVYAHVQRAEQMHGAAAAGEKGGGAGGQPQG